MQYGLVFATLKTSCLRRQASPAPPFSRISSVRIHNVDILRGLIINFLKSLAGSVSIPSHAPKHAALAFPRQIDHCSDSGSRHDDLGSESHARRWYVLCINQYHLAYTMFRADLRSTRGSAGFGTRLGFHVIFDVCDRELCYTVRKHRY